MEIRTLQNNLFSFLKGGGEMARLISAYRWNKSSAGSAENWSPYLKSALSILIHSKLPMLLLWGDQHVCFYNDPFKAAVSADGKHPWALGRTCAEVWSDRWQRIKPLIDDAMAGVNLPLQTDESFPIFSNLDGHPPRKYSLSQVYDDFGEVGGVFITCQEAGAQPGQSAQAEANATLPMDAADVGTEPARQVQERTQKLQELNEELVATNEELSQSNAHLVNANRELEQYAYITSHDLQEPLRKIQTFANILSDRYSGELSKEAATYLSKISASSARMSTLIKNLLDYSRLSHNKPLFQPVNLNSIVENVLNDFEFVMKQKNAIVEVEELPTIEAIPIQMNQLFYNLIGNSLKFIRKGVQPVVKITTKRLSSEEKRDYGLLKPLKHHVEITVSDNGIGFSQQYAEQIFAIFQRLNDRSIYGGYGIGLALCRRIVLNHDGVITASGRENEGASFSFVLPVTHQ
jgi:signal transduction histidine kinase